MLRGHEQEPIARRLYEETNFVDITNGGFFDCVEYGDSPDGLVGNDGVIEIKSVTAAVHYATLQRESFDPAYKWQLIGHLDCTGRDWVDFVSYCSDFPEHRQLISHRLYRKDYEEETNQLRARRKVFLNLVATTCDVIEKS
ncbi:YqaJ viral recombinase family protein [Candidatus Williamhamiltonella defendens]|uniref:YqaJ viral recombinase family protein n=1 Tax=Candidatus Williamhamiltonella defendens TaxID=138072 RepID=UPI0020C63704|nr:YqaJ viral recombinase family protein [Candidatus Hamiltonella defensa]